MDTFKLTIRDKQALYNAYMSFVKGGGLFVPTQKSLQLGDLVKLELELMDSPEIHHIDGKVVWVTPLGASGRRLAGVGVQFQGANALEVHKKIETHLAGMQGTARTHTI